MFFEGTKNTKKLTILCLKCQSVQNINTLFGVILSVIEIGAGTAYSTSGDPVSVL